MEANVWSDPEVLRRLKNDYVVVALYVDEKQYCQRKSGILLPMTESSKKQ